MGKTSNFIFSIFIGFLIFDLGRPDGGEESHPMDGGSSWPFVRAAFKSRNIGGRSDFLAVI